MSQGEPVPRRIQRSRGKGWRMPEGAVYVGRPSRWGNPQRFEWFFGFAGRAAVVGSYRIYIQERLALNSKWLAPLRGRDLVCWCPLDQPCHADVLLEVANESRNRHVDGVPS